MTPTSASPTRSRGLLADELKAMTPDDLGQIDTFREEEHRVLAGAVEALRQGGLVEGEGVVRGAPGRQIVLASARPARRWAWSLVAEAAEFGETLARHPRPFDGATSLEQARRALRRAEPSRSIAPIAGSSRAARAAGARGCRTSARSERSRSSFAAHTAHWADRLAQRLRALCREHGFLPPASMQQRTLFEQVVHPLTLAGEKVAIFLIDAFRYEMATELVDELTGDRHRRRPQAAPRRAADDHLRRHERARAGRRRGSRARRSPASSRASRPASSPCGRPRTARGRWARGARASRPCSSSSPRCARRATAALREEREAAPARRRALEGDRRRRRGERGPARRSSPRSGRSRRRGTTCSSRA